jgi:hypothetical protein
LRGAANSGAVGGKSKVVLEAATTGAHTHPTGVSNYHLVNGDYNTGGYHWHGTIAPSNNSGLYLFVRDDSGGGKAEHWDTTDSLVSHILIGTSGPYYGTDSTALATTSNAQKTHTHPDSTDIGGNAGSNPIKPYAVAHENRPPFFNTVYIMRVI